MPQMAPYNWLILNLYFLIILILFFSLIYFFYFNKNIHNDNTKFTPQSFMIKW